MTEQRHGISRLRRLLARVLSGTADRNLRFQELRTLLLALNVEERVRGSQHSCTRTGIVEILNLQPQSGGLAKPYQVRQVRQLIVKYKLAGAGEP